MFCSNELQCLRHRSLTQLQNEWRRRKQMINLFRCLLTHGHVSFVCIIPINVPIIPLSGWLPKSVHVVNRHFKQIKRQFQKKMFCKWKFNKIRIRINQMNALQAISVCLLNSIFRSPISHKLAVDRKYPFHPHPQPKPIKLPTKEFVFIQSHRKHSGLLSSNKYLQRIPSPDHRNSNFEVT